MDLLLRWTGYHALVNAPLDGLSCTGYCSVGRVNMYWLLLRWTGYHALVIALWAGYHALVIAPLGGLSCTHVDKYIPSVDIRVQ